MYKVGLIGCGARSVSYALPYAQTDGLTVAAISDPDPRQRSLLKEQCGLLDAAQYDDWRDLLAEPSGLHGVVISSPTQFHVDQAIGCYERGIPIALEKPVAPTKLECERLIDAERANGGRTLIGFVLRSTPYFSKVHEVIARGSIGHVLSVQADELPGWLVSSVMFRSPWRRYQISSGGSMLEKCCHDMDMLNWLIGSRPTAIHSFGGKRVFNANPQLPDTCPGCRLAETCNYYQAPEITHEAGAGIYAFKREDLRCIYNIDADVLDMQSVALEYENGAIANFMLNFHTAGKRAGRNLHVVGTRGRLWGNMEMNEIGVYRNATDEVEEIAIDTDGTGHGGGDTRHALELQRMMTEPAYRPEQDAGAGYLSAVMCFAADLSVTERRRVELRYRDDGFVDLSRSRSRCQ